jgi:hypothetical protein
MFLILRSSYPIHGDFFSQVHLFHAFDSKLLMQFNIAE